MKTISAKMKSLTKSFGENEYEVLNYTGQECILIGQDKRNFVFDSEFGKLYVFISKDNPYSIKERYNDTEVEIIIDSSYKGKLYMSKSFGGRKMNADFPVKCLIFKNSDMLIHIKYQILNDLEDESYLTEAEIFIEIGG